ncbi:MAG: VOC family protein [Acidobacteriota bacterium]
MATIPTGKFVWFEYVGKEAKQAQAFFGEVFHWKTQDVPVPGMPGGGTYTMIVAGDKTIGGYLGQPPGAPAQHHWLASLQVADAAATAAKIQQLGGKLRMEPVKMGDFGTKAVVADPFDATFALWQPGTPEGTGDYSGKQNTWCWNELATPDPAQAIAFYKAIGGFEVTDMKSEHGTYHVLETGGKGVAGVTRPMMPQQPTAWLPYVHVASADHTHDQAKRLGAKVFVPPTDIPEIGRFSVFADPNGAAIAILQPSPTMKG